MNIWNARENWQKRLSSVDVHVFTATAPTPNPILGNPLPPFVHLAISNLQSDFLQLDPLHSNKPRLQFCRGTGLEIKGAPMGFSVTMCHTEEPTTLTGRIRDAQFYVTRIHLTPLRTCDFHVSRGLRLMKGPIFQF